jgi:hypothetical protein
MCVFMGRPSVKTEEAPALEPAIEAAFSSIADAQPDPKSSGDFKEPLELEGEEASTVLSS